jgi:NADH:ubiquinone oxidoreductase subunit 4 (subunit M)
MLDDDLEPPVVLASTPIVEWICRSVRSCAHAETPVTSEFAGHLAVICGTVRFEYGSTCVGVFAVILRRKLLICVVKLHDCGLVAAQPALVLQGAQAQGMSAADIAMWQIMRLGRAPDM